MARRRRFIPQKPVGKRVTHKTNSIIQDWHRISDSADPIDPAAVAWSPEQIRQISAIETQYRGLMREHGLEDLIDDNQMRFHYLPHEEADALTEAYGRASGLHDLIAEHGAGKLIGDPDAPYFKLPIQGLESGGLIGSGREINPGVLLFARQNIQVRPVRAIAADSPLAAAYLAGPIPTLSSLRTLGEDLANPVDTMSKTALIYDIETPGLRTSDGIIEISARLRRPGATEAETKAASKSWFFDQGAMSRGTANVAGEAMPLQELIRHKATSAGLNYEYSDPAEGLMEFFDMASQAEIHVGHNIKDFDAPHIVAFAKSQPLYREASQKGDEFRLALAKFERDAHSSKVIDTLELYRSVMGNKIGLDPALEAGAKLGAKGGHYAPFSVQNILLQTDILHKAEDAGIDVTALLKQGEHLGYVDVVLEDFAERSMRRHMMGQEEIQVGAMTNDTWRNSLLRSGAITPHTQITHGDHVVEGLRKTLRDAGLMTDDHVGITYLEQNVLLGRQVDKLVPKVADLKMNPVEVALRSSIWRDFSEEFLTPQGLLKPGMHMPAAAAYKAVQEQMYEAGIPLAGLSLPERILTAHLGAVGHFATGYRETAENAMRNVFGSSLGIGSWQGTTLGPIGTKVGGVPLELMAEAERAHVFTAGTTHFTNPMEGVQRLFLSPFTTRRNSERYGVGLYHEFDKDNVAEEVEKLIAFLHEKPHEGVDLEALREILLAQKKVQVGVMFGGPAARIRNLLVDLAGTESDTSKIHMATMLVDNLTGEENQLHTHGVIMDVLHTPAFDRSLNAAKRAAVAAYQTAHEMAGNTRAIEIAGRIFEHKGINRVQDTPIGRILSPKNLGKFYETYFNHIRPNAGKATLSILGAGIAYYLHHRHKDQRIFDETLAAQPYEDDSDRANYRSVMRYDELPPDTMGRQGARSNTDPMQTAGLVSMLSSNRIGHTRMGPRKYQHLYS